MFSAPPLNVFEANGYQYWPAWMFFNFPHLQGLSANNVPLNFISLDSTFSHQESSCSKEQTPPPSPKLGFTEYRPKEKSETTSKIDVMQIATRTARTQGMMISPQTMGNPPSFARGGKILGRKRRPSEDPKTKTEISFPAWSNKYSHFCPNQPSPSPSAKRSLRSFRSQKIAR